MRIFGVLLAGIGAALSMPAAAATTISLNSIGYNGGGLYGNLHYAPSNNYTSYGPAGRFEVAGVDTVTNAAFNAFTWCIDIFKAVDAGDFTIVPLASLVGNATKQSQLAALLNNADGIIDNPALDWDGKNAAGAAFQLAIWEVVYEAGTSGYDLAIGDFFAEGSQFTSAIQTKANGYLYKVTSGEWMASSLSVAALKSDTGLNQNQIFRTPQVAVPEPATWLTLVVGFGIAGGALRRSRKTNAGSLATA